MASLTTIRNTAALSLLATAATVKPLESSILDTCNEWRVSCERSGEQACYEECEFEIEVKCEDECLTQCQLSWSGYINMVEWCEPHGGPPPLHYDYIADCLCGC